VQSGNFIRDPELMLQFREILGWDEQRERESLRSTMNLGGVMGSAGAGAGAKGKVVRQDLAVICGPSYRRLPASVSDRYCY
jgi:hypothetical protein